MPFKSERQRKWFNANRKKLERQGVDVDEWNRESKGKHYPEFSIGNAIKEARDHKKRSKKKRFS